MNSANCSAPACQLRPVRAHQRRNNAIEFAELFVVDSAPARPNRTCRKKPSATGTTARSSSSTVQYLAPDGKLTGNARIWDSPDLVVGLSLIHISEPTRRTPIS